jgi:hypothetical protein
MKASTRFLVISGVAIGVLVVVTVVLVLTLGNGKTISLLPEDTPEGVVQRYLLALEDEDYEEAYGYLSSTAREEAFYGLSWQDYFGGYGEKPAWQAALGESWVLVNVATVDVTFTIFQHRGLLDPTHTNHVTFRLNKEGDSWGITSPTRFWFLY